MLVTIALAFIFVDMLSITNIIMLLVVEKAQQWRKSVVGSSDGNSCGSIVSISCIISDSSSVDTYVAVLVVALGGYSEDGLV